MKMLVTYFLLCVAILRATSGFNFPLLLDAIWNSKDVRMIEIHEIHCEAYDHYSGVRAEVVIIGFRLPIPVPSEFNDYMRTRCQMKTPNAKHIPANEEFQVNVYNERTGSLVMTAYFYVSNEPAHVTSAQHSLNEALGVEKVKWGEKVKIRGGLDEPVIRLSQPSYTFTVVKSGGATPLSHPLLLTLLLVTFALYEQRV